MFDFVSKMLLARALRLEEGAISVYNIPVNMVPTDVYVELIHRLIKEYGFLKAHDIVYNSAKIGTQEYCKSLKKNTQARDRELAKLYADIVTMAGYGIATITKFDLENKGVVCRFDNSAVAKRYMQFYGKTPYPIDIVTTGLYAGSFNVLFNQENEAVEIHCIAKGDPFCEFIYAKSDIIQPLREKIARG